MRTSYIFYLIGLLASLATPLARASDDTPRSFENVYVGTSLNATYPAGLGQEYYSAGGTSPTLHYRYVMQDRWLLGASAGFKILKDLEGTEAPLFCVEQKTTKLFRIYFPFWLGIGVSGLYVVAVEKISFPYQRNRDIPVQVGAGIHTMLLYRYSSKWMAHVDVNRWGGTSANNKVNVVETGLGVSYAIGAAETSP